MRRAGRLVCAVPAGATPQGGPSWPGPGVKAGVLPGGWGRGRHRGGATLDGHVQRVTGLLLLGCLLSLRMDQPQEGLSVPKQKGVLSCQSIICRESKVYMIQRPLGRCVQCSLRRGQMLGTGLVSHDLSWGGGAPRPDTEETHPLREPGSEGTLAGPSRVGKAGQPAGNPSRDVPADPGA